MRAYNRLKELRKAKKLTQVELASAIGTTQGSIQKLETGEIALDTRWMEKISKVLNIKPCELLPSEWQSSQETAQFPFEPQNFIITFEAVEEYLSKTRQELEPRDKAELILKLCSAISDIENEENKKAKIYEFADFALKKVL